MATQPSRTACGRTIAILAYSLGLSLLSATPSRAQTALGPSVRVATPLLPGAAPTNGDSDVPSLPAPDALFPGILGAGSFLRGHGVAILLDTINEFDGIVEGNHTGTTNAGQYGFETDIDWQKLAGLRGFSTHTVMVGRYGIPASRIFGDNINPSQEIYGAGGNVVVHLVYAYGEETVANGRLDVAAGRIPFLTDFSSSPLYCNFQNNAFCGNPKASSDNLAHSSYPDASWAIRARVRPTEHTYVQTGIYFNDANIYTATDGYRSGFRFNSQQATSQTFPIEIGYEPLFGHEKLPGHYKLGFAYDDMNQNDDYFDVDGSAFVQSGLPPRVRKGATAEWVLIDQMLLRHGPGMTAGLIGLAGFYHNDDTTSLRTDEIEAGLIDHGFWPARPLDGIAVAFAYTAVSGALTRTEELQQELGLPITGTGGTFYQGITPGVQSHTMNIELNYQINVFRGVTFAPDVQYYIRPNAQTNLGNATLIGFKSHIELF